MRIVIGLIFMLLLLGSAEAGTTGKIAGRIMDQSSGEPLAGANVMVNGTNLGASSDEEGYYVIINVPPGKFDLEAMYIGYASFKVQDVQVSTDRTSKLDIRMYSEMLSTETVVVEAERPAVEIDRTHSASIVNSETFEIMPVTEVSEIISLQSGVVSSGGQLHFRGGRAREVAYLIDGIPVTNPYSQNGGNNVSVENAMIEELEVISGTFNAEYGSAQSGVVNIITKAIDDKFSGSFRVYSGEWLSNKNQVFIGVNDINFLAEKDVQFSLSGPVWKNSIGFNVTGRLNSWESLFWFDRRFMPIDGWRIAAYQKWYQQHNSADYNSNQAIPIPDSLRTGDGAMGPLSTGYDGSFSAKLNFIPAPGLNLSYQIYGSYNQSAGGGSSRRYQPDETNTYQSWSHSHFITFKHNPTRSLFYNLALSYQFNDGESFYRKDNKLALYPGDSGIQLISSSADGFSLGTTDGFYTDRDGKNFREQYLINGDLNWQAGRFNFIKAGFLARRHRINTYSRGFRETEAWQNYKWPDVETLNGADYDFNTYWNLISDYWRDWESLDSTHQYGRYAAVADSEYALWRDYTIAPVEAAIYLQDKLELGELIINAGLRFDLFDPQEVYPVELRTEATNLGAHSNLKNAGIKTQLSPRLGISFPVSSAGAFHASYGHFFQMPSFEYMYNEPLYTLTPIQLTGRRLGNADLKPEKTIAYEIGVQQEIGQGIAVDVTAYYKDFRNLLGIEQITTIDAVTYTRFVNRDYGNTKGLSLSLSKNTGMITGNINYTYAFANGSSSDPNTLYLIQTATSYGGENVQFAERKVLPLDWDQRHTLNAAVNINRPDDWSIGITGYLHSGQPYSPTFTDRYDIATREYRNLDIKPSRWNIDLKAKKELNLAGIRAGLFLKIDNLFDHLNQEYVHASTGAADQIARLPEDEALERERLQQEGHFTLSEVDASPTYYSAPRKVQIGLEFNL